MRSAVIKRSRRGDRSSLPIARAWRDEQRGAVEAAGFESGEGFIKLPYERPLPTKLLKSLMKARIVDYEASSPE